MNIITVIPLTRSKVADELSYFASSDVPVGAIVNVPLRSKSIHAIVTEVKPAEDLKSSIKRAGFVIRKLGKVKKTMFFPVEFVDASSVIAKYYATTMGSIIHSMVSEDILDNAHKMPPPLPRQNAMETLVATNDNTLTGDRVFVVQGDEQDRIGSWRSLIRQEFARKRSVAIFLPTIEDAKSMFISLEKGIEGYIFLLTGGMTSKKLSEAWQKIYDTDHPVTVIATGQFCLLPRGDIYTVIIERENSRDWISRRAPYLDLRFALECLAKKRRQTLYLADNLLRTETLYRLAEHEVGEGSPFKWRSISTAKDMLIDMRRFVEGRPPEPESFRVLSPTLEDLIRENIEGNTHLFIYNTRRGYSPNTICGDCQSVVICKQCSAPVVLHTSKETGRNFFMCHKCGERRSADETCVSCGSWRLITIGIGIDRVKEEILKAFPNADLYQVDSDNTRSVKAIDDTIAKFRSKPGSILIGTGLVLSHLYEKVDHVAVSSIDSLFALPDFRIQEKIMHTITRLRAQAVRTILVQTRLPDEKVFEYAMKGNLSDFYRSTLDERAAYRYPPLSTLIKVSIEGRKDVIAKSMAKVQEQFAPYEIDVFPAFTSTVKGNSMIHGLIKIDQNAWPDPDLVSRIRSLPPGIAVRIGPESLL